jgi:hypothetical protein
VAVLVQLLALLFLNSASAFVGAVVVGCHIAEILGKQLLAPSQEGCGRN